MSGSSMTMNQPITPTIHAASSPHQRKRHAPRTSSRTSSTNAFMSEARLRYDDHVARLKSDVLPHIAFVDDPVEVDTDRDLLAALHAHDLGPIACRVLPESTHRQQGIEHGHAFPVGQR